MSRPDFNQQDSAPLEHRYEFVLLFDVNNGNPNGDPDADNAPRVDPETGHGLVTDVCIKRKVRNYVSLTQRDKEKGKDKYKHRQDYDIYVKERGILANEQRKAYQQADPKGPIEPDNKPNIAARAWMCKNYFDIRTFGAVMTTGKAEMESDAEANKSRRGRGETKLWNCGQVRGPVQFSFARSIDPILAIGHTITRVALTNSTDSGQTAVISESGDEKASSGQMGRKYAVPYALYSMHGFISPFLAEETGFARRDMGLLLEALQHLFDLDRSAARGEMEVRGLYLFEHNSKLGSAPAYRLFESVKIAPVTTPRTFADYCVSAPDDGAEIVPGVTAWRYV
jgi:CRISPR-associated protein Csd2